MSFPVIDRDRQTPDPRRALNATIAAHAQRVVAAGGGPGLVGTVEAY
jgi:hypothetical protein